MASIIAQQIATAISQIGKRLTWNLQKLELNPKGLQRHELNVTQHSVVHRSQTLTSSHLFEYVDRLCAVVQIVSDISGSSPGADVVN